MWLVAHFTCSVNAIKSTPFDIFPRYSSLNEINKFRKECNGKIFVYFITKLSRMEGGTSYVGFHGGKFFFSIASLTNIMFVLHKISLNIIFIRPLEVSAY